MVYGNEKNVRDMIPDMEMLTASGGRGVIITAPGDNVDFVSRFFAPQSGIPEDPVTGSAHTTLVPYWAGKLGKHEFTAWQLSQRGGTVTCRLKGNRVFLLGEVRLYLSGYIFI